MLKQSCLNNQAAMLFWPSSIEHRIAIFLTNTEQGEQLILRQTTPSGHPLMDLSTTNLLS